MLDKQKKVIADRGYRHDKCINSLANALFPHGTFARARAWHEVVNNEKSCFTVLNLAIWPWSSTSFSRIPG